MNKHPELRQSLWCMLAGFTLLIGCVLTITPGIQPGIPALLGVAGFCALALAAILVTNDGDI